MGYGTYGVPDHPMIRAMERYGYPDPKMDREPVCPVCGDVCEEIYRERKGGDVLGCGSCITRMSMEDVAGFDGQETPTCPGCGTDCDTVYVAKDDGIVGCWDCVSSEPAWECDECFGD